VFTACDGDIVEGAAFIAASPAIRIDSSNPAISDGNVFAGM
jgi:hypothetical protein